MSDATETRYSVQGMKCGGCVTKATEAVSKLPGYVAVQFDLKAGTAVVRGRVEPLAVVQALTAAGYPAVVSQD
jgi:copper chaperone CopZ